MGLNYISKKYTLPIKVAIAEIAGIECDIEFILPEQAKNIVVEDAPKSPSALSNDIIENQT